MATKFWKKCAALAACACLLTVSWPFSAMAEENQLKLVATVFPAYDFARVVGGDRAAVTLLLPPGGDSHSYEPTPQDIIAIQQADLFIYVGGESDAWIERVLESLGADAPPTFAMMDCVTALSEELTASMAAENGGEHGAEEAHADDDGAAHDAHDGAPDDASPELDEHVWTSPRNAMAIADALAERLCALAPESAGIFTDNAAYYQAELKKLDEAFKAVVANGRRNLLIFGDRFPFRYFAAAYGLTCDAAFPGCSEDSEPSVKTVISLVSAIRDNQIPVVFYIEFSSRKTADILCEETGAKPLLFHSCHAVSAQEMADGVSYLSLMWQNVEALREALD